MSSDINVQTFSGKVNITSNLLVGTSHLFVDTINNRVGLVTSNPDAGLHVNSNAYVHTDFRVGSGIVMNDTNGRITAGSFVGDGSAMTGINSDSGSWVNGTNSNVHLATSTDNVGIGTTTPKTNFHVGQQLSAANGNTIPAAGLGISADFPNSTHAWFANRVNATGDEYWGLAVGTIYTGSSYLQNLNKNTGTYYHILLQPNGGNVGIGTSSPQQNLHVHESGSGQVVIAVTNDTTGGGNNDGIHFGIDGSEQGFVWHKQNTALLFATNNAERMRINNVGNVGIGTSSPIGKLDVRGAIMTPVISYSSNQDAPYLIAGTSGYTGAATNWNTHGFQHRIKTNSGGVPRITVDAPSGGEVFSIVNGGNVGIGTTSPNGKLHISTASGDSNSSDNALIIGGPINCTGNTNLRLGCHNDYAWIQSHCGEPLVLNPAGNNVGIGTTSPQSLLQVPRPAVAYDKVIQLGTQTTYADGDLYSLGFGGNALMGIGLATGTRSVFGRQGMATHIPNTETWGIYTNSWTKLINVDGSTRRVYFGHTDKFNLFYAPSAWSYSTTSTSETNLWTFTVSIPQDGYLIVSSNGHWSNNTANQWVYAKIGVDSADPADTSGFYDSFTGGGASTNGGDFHGYKDSSVSWQDFNWSGTLKVSAGTRTICMRVKVSGGTFSLNGAAVNMLYIPKNYF